MAINIKKGTAHTLAQSDKLGPRGDAGTAAYQVLAGMVVGLNTTTGAVAKAVTTTSLVLGFAVNNYTDGDVIESGKIGIYLLDGNSVIETDQVVDTVNSTNFPVGAPVYADFNNGTGKVTATSSSNKLIGYVEGIRTLPQEATLSQNWVNLSGNTVTNSSAQQSSVAFLGIKVAAAAS